MTRPEFSPQLRAALDSYKVPALPAGFADRALARALGPSRLDTALPPAAPGQRPTSANPWRRAGRVVLTLAAVSTLSATAAAMGVFGEQLRVPVVSEVLEELDLVQPSPVKAQAGQRIAESGLGAVGLPPAGATMQWRGTSIRPVMRTIVKQRLRARIRENHKEGAATTTRAERVREAVRARRSSVAPAAKPLRRALVSGAGREALKERAAQLPPPARAKLREAITERRQSALPDRIRPNADLREALRERVETSDPAAPPIERPEVRPGKPLPEAAERARMRAQKRLQHERLQRKRVREIRQRRHR